jgi:ubiquinone/menaquinone biosynthesis C-methylase UbiE
VGWYADRVFPRLMNVVLDTRQTREIRARVCADLSGDVIEIGFGTGLNLPHLPDAVRRVKAVDPSRLGTRLAGERMRAAPAPVEVAGLDGQRLPFADHSADAVLSTWTLCSIADPVAAVREVRRVLRPGGALHFVEHGLAPDASVQRWQHRLNGLEQRLADGCNLDRNIADVLEAGGLTIVRLTRYYAKGEPKVFGSLYEGVAGVAD